MTQPDPTAVRRARHEGAIEAFRSAAERMSLGAAVGPVPLEARPAVETWLRRLAEQRLDRARKEAAAPAAQSPADRSALRDRIAEALLTTRRTDYADLNVKADHRNHRFDARCALCTYDVDALTDSVLEAFREYLDISDAEAWCKTCRRVWEGPQHRCESDAEQNLSRARALHQERCPLAQGKVEPAAFTCSMCEALGRPAASLPPAERAVAGNGRKEA
ncbi:hypothetical protein [Streptomyces olivaceoviridis]|uniref:hypothetical protein n=1 Tax=Streptomyces olivaceoviridis TaxID=1921 RepID=UPI0036C9264F